jgi:hypothetical protein
MPVSLDAARRVIESLIIAVVTSTGLYLVGTVYTNAFFGRMSIDAAALDLTPPYIALQSVHVVESLLQYPLIVGMIYLLYRGIVSRFPVVLSWARKATQRFGRLALLIANILIVLPLLNGVVNIGQDLAVEETSDVLGEVGSLIVITSVVLLVYLLWLSLVRREFLLTQLREHKLLPITLIVVLYLLDALIVTAIDAGLDAELLMAGLSDRSIAVTFTMASGAEFAPSKDLLLVAIRNGHYFVVQRQSIPPSRQPISYAIPVRAVDAIQLQRVNAAGSWLTETLYGPLPTPPPSR